MNIEAHLATLRQKHGELDAELQNAMNHPSTESSVILDLKRKKLRLKDEIERIRSSLH
ncbi:YdcH family protein [Rhizobium sp. L1K21]|uniref:YdcH family protein n=1 Tax=Rhizobium sp. L1K21 TaxID=2954933 RepID=UPI002093C149|nr:DUF465 domain-containing protein [Rhizobium sp. L1K21]MCO6185057.1 DUF465 domain-containing protein [Rhizobium sp. L1K21]